jgi:hypothetical protein
MSKPPVPLTEAIWDELVKAGIMKEDASRTEKAKVLLAITEGHQRYQGKKPLRAILLDKKKARKG